MCPICGQVTSARLCPSDQIATLLVDPPRIDASRVEEGTLIDGRYVVETLIGRGGFGSVFRARHTGTGQQIALKCLSTIGEHDDTHLRRFFQEARVTAGLRHPNTIRVFDFGQDDSGLVYLAMELLDGVTLKQELRARRKDDRVFTMTEALKIGVGVCRSLTEAHRAGLVHRDLKPDNIFLHHVEGDEPAVKVLDFGIVKFANSTLTLGSDSGVPGTPAFMSPEQVVKRDLDGRSDLYSLGVVLYQLVSGSVPLRGESIVQTLYMHVHESPPELRPRVRTPVTMRFCELVHRTLSKNPAHRPSTANDMREELERCLAEALHEPATKMISRTSEHPVYVPGNETLTTPNRPEALPRVPSLFSNPHVDPQDISMADVPSRRDVLPAPRAAVPAWVIAGLVVVLGLLGGVLLIVLTSPTPTVPVPVEAPTARHDPVAPTEDVTEPLVEAEVTAPAEALEAAPVEEEAEVQPVKSRTKRRIKRRRARPAPPSAEERETDEILDQKI